MAEENRGKEGYSATESEIAHEARKMDLEYGILSKFFGSGKNAPVNIAGLIIVVLIISGVALQFIFHDSSVADYWKFILPVVTLALGYLFGHL